MDPRHIKVAAAFEFKNKTQLAQKLDNYFLTKKDFNPDKKVR